MKDIKLDKELIKRLPKTDLHVHLDGSLRIATLIELAKEQNVELPTFDVEELAKLIVCGEHTQSLDDYLRGFHIVNLVLQEKAALTRAAYELAEDAAQENLRYLELRYSPILHTDKGLKLDEISQAVLNGLQLAERDFGIQSGVIICGIRNLDPANSLRLAKLAADFKNRGVVAFDLAGGEYNHPAKDHLAAFEYAKEKLLNITIHAGEAEGADSIRQALQVCGAHRIGHGTRLSEDSALMDYVNDHRIPLEICLTSNLHTKAVNDIRQHPLPLYLKSGICATLNTDNRSISNTTMTDEYMLAIQSFDLDYPAVKTLILNGFKSAFLPHQKRLQLLNSVLAELEAIEQEF